MTYTSKDDIYRQAEIELVVTSSKKVIFIALDKSQADKITELGLQSTVIFKRTDKAHSILNKALISVILTNAKYPKITNTVRVKFDINKGTKKELIKLTKDAIEKRDDKRANTPVYDSTPVHPPKRIDHIPPQNIDAERAVLGACLLNPEAIDTALKVLGHHPGDVFFNGAHQMIYEALVAMSGHNTPIDITTLIDQLNGHLPDIGGISYLSDLTGAVPTSANIEYYAKIVSTKAMQRLVIRECTNTASKAYTDDQDIEFLTYTHLNTIEKISEGAMDDGPEILSMANMVEYPAPETRYLFQDMIPLDIVAGLTAQGGLGKSFFTLTLAVSAAIGRCLLPSFIPTATGPVLCLQGEDPGDEIHRRIEKIIKAYELTDEDKTILVKNLHIASTSSFPLCKVVDSVIEPTNQYRWLQTTITNLQPQFVILDPRASFFAGEENSNSDVHGFFGLLRDLTTTVETGCTVWTVHHVSKEKGNTSHSDAGRGATAARDAMRAVLSLTPIPDNEFDTLGLQNPHLWARLELTKANFSGKPPGPIYLQRGINEVGGVLFEVDVKARKQEIKDHMKDKNAQELANIIGQNLDDLSKLDILRNKTGKWVRDELRSVLNKPKMTNSKIAEIMDNAISTGLVNIQEVDVLGGKMNVPRKPVQSV